MSACGNGPHHYVRAWGGGWGFGGATYRIDNDTFFGLMLQGRLRYSLGETLRRIAHNRRVDEIESLEAPGMDAAAISFDDV